MIRVDARGDRCPIPVIKTKKAIEELKGPGVIEVLVDNETAVKNVEKMAGHSGAACEVEKLSEKEFRLTITMEKEADADKLKNGDGAVVVVATDQMGAGDEELGKLLIKGFLFAVSQLEPLPDTVLFYNGGARLTVEGSDALEDLKYMESQGVEILTCGTCLNHFGLTEKLAVGSVTNMYSIVEKMAQAGKVIRP
ncbi:sulfurtransferase-like selenium metabolism protein YedF [Diplocloster agilis]|uniref:sulfurtransferase-like selenium metabolism protein YedF n=1 Tax=Diplocloster agilis TaxID=2850323 RepID=UPI0008230799|nr:sulfurtransferase-like selenium metabolism protein YedF [Suonthocola fibrivorans]MCU6733454.1 sulfurtransferase-like selenium metabolism protein YedF [Suonthocola fibrivorans]SCI93797.1 selenium metabolism protein YedF [uncultured Clostridium sp.]